MFMASKSGIEWEWEHISTRAGNASIVTSVFKFIARREHSTRSMGLMWMVQSRREDILVSLWFMKGIN